jgi:hypothetical protein
MCKLFRHPREASEAKLGYAGAIEETANGRGSRLGGETRGTLQVLAQRRLEGDGAVDERKTVARFREDQTQEVADEEEPQKIIGKVNN